MHGERRVWRIVEQLLVVVKGGAGIYVAHWNIEARLQLLLQPPHLQRSGVVHLFSGVVESNGVLFLVRALFRSTGGAVASS